MAPVAPPKMSHRAKVLARLADPTLLRKVHRADNTVTDAFLHSKRDKQLIRKSAFRAQVADRHRAGGLGRGRGEKAPLKRRRPSKKLVTTLESLVDALPDVAEDGESKVSSGGRKTSARASLRSRPGALKRKEKLVQAEMARFGASLAQLTTTKEETVVAPAPDSGDGDGIGMEVQEAGQANTEVEAPAPAPVPRQSTANRFALLRNFISATMEQNPAFATKSS